MSDISASGHRAFIGNSSFSNIFLIPGDRSSRTLKISARCEAAFRATNKESPHLKFTNVSDVHNDVGNGDAVDNDVHNDDVDNDLHNDDNNNNI